MKRIVRLAVAFLIVFTFVFSVKPISSVNAEETKYDLWVGKHQVTSENMDNIPVLDGSASYDPETQTLTLKDVTKVDGTKTDTSNLSKYSIYTTLDVLTIKGYCNISASNLTSVIYSTEDIILDGSIDVNNTSTLYDCYGIRALGDIYIKSGDINISAISGSGVGISCDDLIVVDGFIDTKGDYEGILATGKVYFEGGYVTAEGTDSSFGDAITSSKGININGDTHIFNPSGGEVKCVTSEYHIFNSSSQRVQKAEIGVMEENYGLKVMGVPVNNYNRFDIKAFPSGHVSFDPSSNTLYFENVSDNSNISSPDPIVDAGTKIETLTIMGKATLIYSGINHGFYSPGKLKILGDFDITTKDYVVGSMGCEVLFAGGNCTFTSSGYSGMSFMAYRTEFLDGTYIFNANQNDYYSAISTYDFNLNDGMYILEPEGGYFDSTDCGIKKSDNTKANKVKIGPKDYSLRVGGVQVTTANCKAIPSVYDGSASYDPETKTLTFEDYSKIDNSSTFAIIDTEDDLTIKGNMYLRDTRAQFGIRSLKGLTIDGDIHVDAKLFGSYTNDDLVISEDGFLDASAMEDSDGKGIYCQGDIDVAGCLNGYGCNIGIYAKNSIDCKDNSIVRAQGDQYGVRAGKDFKNICMLEAESKNEAVSVGGEITINREYGFRKDSYYDEATDGTHLSDDKKHFLTSGNDVAKKVYLEDKYCILVCGKKLTYDTRNDIQGLTSGKGTFDADTCTLNLDNAVLKHNGACIDSYLDLNIVTKGDVSVIADNNGAIFASKLTVDGNLYAEANEFAIYTFDFELKNGCEILIPEGGKYDNDKYCIVDKDGKPAKIVKIGKKSDVTPTPTPGTTPAPGSTPTPGTTPEPGTVSPGNTIEDVEAVILALPNDNDPAGSDFATLQAKASKVTKNSIKLTWKKVEGAASYYIYGNKCGVKNKYKRIKVVSKTTFTQKKLKKGTYYKYLIVAVDKDGKVLSTSKTIHAATTGGKVGNAKSLTTKAKKNKVTLKKGKTFKLKAKQKAANKKLKVKKHRPIQYESTNPAVATVNTSGKIKAVGKGKCDIYVYAQNGITKKIKVTVK
ncbi:MAG: Ig-like domain-containing protein [Eubacterium sp.]|nr:Ig-like domain-containing protein [Eubacterium sp.]